HRRSLVVTATRRKVIHRKNAACDSVLNNRQSISVARAERDGSEPLENAAPTAALPLDAVDEGFGQYQALDVAMLQLDPGFVRPGGYEADFNLTGAGWIRVVLPHAAYLPGHDQAMWRFPNDHVTPLTLAAVHTLFVPAATFALLEDSFGHFHLTYVIFAWPPAVERHCEGAKRPID